MDLSIPVALLHVAAFSMGYFICKGLGFNEKTCRTVSIETGTCLQAPAHLAAFPHSVQSFRKLSMCLGIISACITPKKISAPA